MSNFDFLKSFNKDLYEIGMKLEDDVLDSPRAVTADATLFLETLVKDIYRQTNHKMENNLVSFYKKIDNLYRMGVITYIYKNKLQDAYNLRNKIHKSNLDLEEEKSLALDIHQRLYYISKKYFQDYCADKKYIQIPEYVQPIKKDIHFKNCIICGSEKSNHMSNMCEQCNRKIENANLLLSLKNTFENDNFTRQEIIESGIMESESISLLKDLSKDNVVIRKGNYYIFNDDKLKEYLDEIDEYIEINRLITKFYRDETTASEIKSTLEYWKGSIHQKPFIEFYNLITSRLEEKFEQYLCQFENIKKSMKLSNMDQFNVKEWYGREKDKFNRGSINDAFILYNNILIKEFFNLKKKGLNDEEIMAQNVITLEIFEFWKNDFMGNDFFKKTSEIKKSLILKEVKKNRYLNQALKNAGVSKEEFNKLYIISKKSDDYFYRQFNEEYTIKRQKLLVKNLKFNSLNRAVRMCKVTKLEFMKWYFNSETELSEFYLKSTEYLMDKYLYFRQNGWNKQDILRHMQISKSIFKSWSKHPQLDIVKDFERKNSEITASLLKRGLIINALKEGKSKQEAILLAGLTPKEFVEIYNSSKREKSDFHHRFDREYAINRKRLFSRLIKDNDFFNAIEKSEISQTEFNKWYLKDQDRFISNNQATEFYLKTTTALMDKYLKARWNGKNKPDAARCVGLSNIIINKWMKHVEFDLFYDFKKKNKQLTIDLIVKGFNESKSKGEVSEVYDIPIKTIDEFIELGKVGYAKFEQVYELYENLVIPSQLEMFYENFKSKSFNRSLKQSRLTREELDYYYNLGKSGDGKFVEFHKLLLDLKIRIYVTSILSKKSSKIALKNSALEKDEYMENKKDIEDIILDKRMEAACESLTRHKTNGARLAKEVGVSVDDIYDWYFRGKEGEAKFKEFYLIFEFGMIIPRVVAFNKALSIGLPKNWIYKQMKKDLGSKDFEIWKEHDILNRCDVKTIKINGEQITDEKLIEIFKNFKFTKSFKKAKDNEAFEFMKKAFYGNQKFSQSLINISSDEEIEKNQKEILGN